MAVEVPHWSKGSVILMGLVHKTTPVEARSAHKYQLIDVYPDEKIKDQLEVIAVILNRHINNSPFLNFHCAKVPSGISTLGYLLASVYLEHVPTGMTSVSSTPKLKQVTRLPLAQWDNLYYALQADIRQLYAALNTEIGLDVAAGHKIMHLAGPGGASTNQPYSVLDLATQLEEMWFVLNDQHLIARLDQVIRIKTIKSGTSVEFGSDQDPVLLTLAAALKPEAGLSNTHVSSAQNIALMLYKKIDAQFHAEAKKSTSDGEKQRLLAAARGEARIKAVAAHTRNLDNTKINIACSCQQTCHCRAELDCSLEQGECPCAFSRYQVCDLVRSQQELHDTIEKDAEAVGLSTPRSTTFLKASTDEEARMQIAGLATADPYIVQMCNYNAEEAARREDHSLALHKSRSRTGRNHYELAYVPRPMAPGRAPKDQYPLAFYDSSPQRYPRMLPGTNANAPRAFDSANMPPPPIVQPMDLRPRGLTYGEGQVPALPIDSALHSTPATYPRIPTLQHDRRPPWDDSPVAAAPKQYDLDENVSASEYSALAKMARQQVKPFGKMDDDPFVDPTAPDTHTRTHGTVSEQDRHLLQHAPKPHVRTNTRSDDTPLVHSPINHQKVRSEPYTSKPHPPLPPGAHGQPVHDPRTSPPQDRPLPPLPRQRWVSAGGTTKLSERPEIDGPDVQFNSFPTGGTMSKAAMFERLNDPDVIEHTMQQNRVSTEKHGSTDRNSNDREHHDPATPQPHSSPAKYAGEKHGRQDSASSSGRGRLAKLKRVFSRSGGSP